DPRYSGCATHRYGPDDVTSRDLLRWPAAQKRSYAQTAAIDMPSTIDRTVGCAKTSVATPHRKPSATRLRASTATTESTIGNATFDGVDPFPRLDVEQAHAIEFAPAEMMTLTDRLARDRDVARHEGPIPRRTRGPEDPDNRRADSRRDVRGPGIAEHQHARAAGQRH